MNFRKLSAVSLALLMAVGAFVVSRDSPTGAGATASLLRAGRRGGAEDDASRGRGYACLLRS